MELKFLAGARMEFCIRMMRPVAILAVLGIASAVYAQNAAGSLHGTVTDPSGAAVSGAAVIVLTPDGQARTTTTNRTGAYEIIGLAPGKYTVTVSAAGFSDFAQDDVTVAAGEAQLLNIPLAIAVEKEKVNVTDEGTAVDTSPSANAGAIVLSGKDLDALPDDPDELQTDLEALAGPSAGPNGGQIYIDGFTAGQLPPKSSIREIRINQNPFSSEYDKLGYGRIEIFTKPGTDKYHGQLSVLGNSSAFNSQNPFLIGSEPDYHSIQYMGNIGGPLGKKASFFFDAQRRNIDEIAIINATILDPSADPNCSPLPTCVGMPYSAAVPQPHTRTNISPRFDYQVSKNNTLTARYQYFRNTEENSGVGGFALQDQGVNSTDTEHTVQISDTQVLSTKVINETRFQFRRENDREVPLSTAPTISVPNAFTSGGASGGTSTDQQEHYELQNYTSMSLGTHFLKFGGRLRDVHEVSTAAGGFNGSWIFQDLGYFQQQTPFQLSLNAVPNTTTSIVPTVTVNVVDVGLYIQDDWRVRPNFTLSYGLRFETQNDIHDHGDFAPRLALAWGIGGGGKNAPKTVLRAGVGLFYDRFSEGDVLQATRFDGLTQLQYIAQAQAPPPRTKDDPNPPQPPIPGVTYPNIPSQSDLQSSSPTFYQVDPRLHSPYIFQSAVTLERQLTKVANVTVSYLNSRGYDQLFTRNINAPIPTAASTYPIDVNDVTLRPLGNVPVCLNSATRDPEPCGLRNIYQYTTEGIFRQNQLVISSNVRAGAKLTLFGYYTLNSVHSNTSGGFPSNQYDIDLDYGRAAYDIRHRVFFGGSISGPYGFRLSPFLIATSGAPYNVSLGSDWNGDSVYNDRPSFAASCGPVADRACYNRSPLATDTRIPINYLNGPAQFTLNLRLAKTFGFGKENATGGAGPGGGGHGGGGPRGGGGFGGGPRAGMGAIFGPGNTNHRYNLTFSVNARNVLNRVNLAAPIGNLSSPNFGQSVALAGGPFSSAAANRKIELQASFSF
jgi:uncharacterized membrane protein YgcG